MNTKPPAFARACREARDVASKNEYDPVSALICLARIGQGGSIVADLLLSFEREYTFNLLGHPHRLLYQHWLHILPPLEYLNGFDVCLLMISIHTSDTPVIDSGLFGSLTTPIQLVDTSDRATIRRMYELWRTTFHDDVKLKDLEPKEIFEEMVLTPDEFESRVRLWHEEFEQRWLWSKWIGKFHKNTLHTIDLPENVFTGPKFDLDGNAVTGLDPMNIKMPMHGLNKAHPWVRATIESMPHFRSVIMFRYCKAKCYSLELPEFKRPEFMTVLHDEQITAIA